jgi:glycosyltransferase involved in cell wall biosynthesis
MGPPNALHQLVQAVTLLPAGDRARLVCILIGDGTERQRLHSLAASLTSEVKFVGTHSQDVVAAVMPRCHAGFIGWLNRPLYRFGVSPQKLAMMLGRGLPVIHAIPDGLEAWAQRLPGWHCRAEDPPSLARAISQMLGTPSGDFDRLRHASIECANDKFDWNRIAAASLEELSQL